MPTQAASRQAILRQYPYHLSLNPLYKLRAQTPQQGRPSSGNVRVGTSGSAALSTHLGEERPPLKLRVQHYPRVF
eukprot:1094173-Pelagomonas_calceolata.AAC.1